MIRIYEIGDRISNASGLSISTENKIIEKYNHSFNTAELIIIKMFFEITLYPPSTDYITYNLVLYPEGIKSFLR